MIVDPVGRGRALASFWLAVCPRLWSDLEESGLLPAGDAAARTRQREEWEHLALHACVRGLVAAGGFGDDTARAVDALHERVLEEWMLDVESLEAFAERRARLAERYQTYGAIEQAADRASRLERSRLLGEAAARCVAGADATDGLAELLGTMHDTLAAGAAEAVRIAVEPAE